MENKNECKYLHLLWGSDLKFIQPLLNIFFDPDMGMNSSQHYFVTPHEYLYEEIKKYENIILDADTMQWINKYGDDYRWIISHGINYYCLLYTKRKYLPKVILRTWGGLLSNKSRTDTNVVKQFYRNLFFAFCRMRMSNFAAIGVANVVDVLDIKKCRQLKNLPLYYIGYFDKQKSEILESYSNLKQKVKNECLNILVGHRGTNDNEHIYILEQLKPYLKEKIHIYIPMSYGDLTYINQVIDFVNEFEGRSKITIITDFMEYRDYIDFLSKIDVAIFYADYSYALGNIGILLKLGKKFFLNSKGLIAEAFEYEKLPYGKIEEISEMGLDSFSTPVIYEKDSGSTLIASTYIENILNWKKLFEDLGE